MELYIGNTIMNLRKGKEATQEQLATAVGVSVAAVSKWETGNSYPDITLLPSIAAFFDVSIDTLLNYSVNSESLNNYRKKAEFFANNGDHKGGISVVEEALGKYPNDFVLNNSMGNLKLYSNKTYAESIPYLEKAISLHTKDCGTLKETIINNLSYAYAETSDYAKAIELLETINESKNYDPQIAEYMISLEKYTEAKEKIQSYIYKKMIVHFSMLTRNLAKCYVSTAQENQATIEIELLELNLGFYKLFVNKDTPSFCDLLCSFTYWDLAKVYKEQKQENDMWINLEQAVVCAKKFDEQPSTCVSSVWFMESFKGTLKGIMDSTSSEKLLNMLEDDFKEFSEQARFIEIDQKLRAL